jgi:hypothetical protein
MRKLISIAAAVGAVLASTGAFALDEAGTAAAQIKLVVSGASAQRDTFNSELQKLCKTVSPDFDTYSTNNGFDFRAYSCTLDSNANNPNVPVSIENQTVAVYYRSEGGSVYGVGPLLAANPSFATGVKRLLVNTGVPCTNAGITGAHVCTLTGYDFTNDGETTSPARLGNDPSDLGVTDVEPNKFVDPNWPTISVLGASPTGTQLTQLNTLNATSVATTGTVFGIFVSTVGPTAGLTSITSEAVSSIFSGAITDWSKVHDAADGGQGAALPAGTITVCRREPGSGTQVAAQFQFTDTQCGKSPLPFLADPNAIENNTTAALNTCVANAAGGRIGFRSIGGSTTAGTKLIKLDGVTASKLNAATGIYSWHYEATAQRRAGLTGTRLALANALISSAQKATVLANDATSNAFALPSFNTPIFPVSTNQPIALGVRSKNSCKRAIQVN